MEFSARWVSTCADRRRRRRCTSLWLLAWLAVAGGACWSTPACAEDVDTPPATQSNIQGPVYITGPVYLQPPPPAQFQGERLPVLNEPGGIGWYAAAEVLVMRANRRGLTYAIVDPDGDVDVEGTVLNLDNDLPYDAGLRATIGASLSHHDRIDFTYMLFSQRTASSVLEPPGGRIWIPIMPPDQTENYTRVDASYDLTLNVYDVTYHRSFTLFGGAARVAGGVRIADVSQDFDVLGSIGGGGSNPEDNYETSVNFLGAGPRIGFGFERGLIGNVSLVASAYGSLLLGRFDTNVFLDENNNVEIDITEEFSQTVPVADIELGLLWQPGFMERFRFFFGWQQMNWFNMSPVQQFIDDGGNDQGAFVDLSHDLSLSAFFTRIEFRQ